MAMCATPSVFSYDTGRESLSIQHQMLTPLITAMSSGAAHLSGGVVRMPPGAMSRTHVHTRSEIIVAVLAGEAATILWRGGGPQVLVHGPSQMCFIPPGFPHCAVNVSSTDAVLALEFRSDPNFNDDVTLIPELEDSAALCAAALRAEPPLPYPRGFRDRAASVEFT